MKKFESILKMTQGELKKYLHEELKRQGYNVVNQDGYLYAKGTNPVLLVAHMDRHPMLPNIRVKTIVKEKVKLPNTTIEVEKWSSPEGIAGDDRCGVWTVLNVIKETRCSVLFTEDEELGCKGAAKFAGSEYVKKLDVNYIVQIDRHGSNDLVFYTNDNKEFHKWCEENTDYETAIGSYTDICEIMGPSGIAGVNISCGYYGEHKATEYIMMNELDRTIMTVKRLVKVSLDKPWQYVKKTYPTYSSWYNDDYDWYGSYGQRKLPGVKTYKSKKKERRFTDKEYNATPFGTDQVCNLKLIVEYTDIESCINERAVAFGNNKAECWMRFFMDNPDLCFNDIVNIKWE